MLTQSDSGDWLPDQVRGMNCPGCPAAGCHRITPNSGSVIGHQCGHTDTDAKLTHSLTHAKPDARQQRCIFDMIADMHLRPGGKVLRPRRSAVLGMQVYYRRNAIRHIHTLIVAKRTTKNATPRPGDHCSSPLGRIRASNNGRYAHMYTRQHAETLVDSLPGGPCTAHRSWSPPSNDGLRMCGACGAQQRTNAEICIQL